MYEPRSEWPYLEAKRVAESRAALIVRSHGLPLHLRDDLKQEVFLELWRKHRAYNPRRGSWRTFAERVATNRLISVLRTLCSTRSAGVLRDVSVECASSLEAPGQNCFIVRADISRILDRVSAFDRRVVLSLVDLSPLEVSDQLGVSRSTVYRAIDRLRIAFTIAGLTPYRETWP
jgi:RNA polymerase sigma factor (sigma-70 family)